MSTPDEQGHPSDPWAWPDERYATRPRWDIGRPQPALLALAEAGQVQGRVLDAGCGTGEHALMAARLGLDATGIDLAASALEQAGEKARQRGLKARFLRYDARRLAELGQQFDTVLDCGLFHCFEEEEGRRELAKAVRAVTPEGARYFMMCFSDQQPGTWGPHRVTRAEIETSFTAGWRIDKLERASLDVAFEPGTAAAWSAVLTRVRS